MELCRDLACAWAAAIESWAKLRLSAVEGDGPVKVVRGCGGGMLGFESRRFSRRSDVEDAAGFSAESVPWKRSPIGSLFSTPKDIGGING